MPFFDDFESGTGNWLTARGLPPATYRTAAPVGALDPERHRQQALEHSMELIGAIDLSDATDPQLTFWVRGGVGYRGSFAAQSSTNGGLTWVDLPAPVSASPGPRLAPLPGLPRRLPAGGVRIRFAYTKASYGSGTNMFVDDVAIEEMPSRGPRPSVPHLKSIDLSWSESALGDFDRYEVYRSTSANVTVANDLSSPRPTPATSPSPTPGSPSAPPTTTASSSSTRARSQPRPTRNPPPPSHSPSRLPIPWKTSTTGIPTAPGAPTAPAPTKPPSPSTTRPATTPPSSDTYILTAIDLSGSTWPVLSFWDRHGLANDWGNLYVSPNGTSWYRIYTASGSRTSWAEQRVDLSLWKNCHQPQDPFQRRHRRLQRRRRLVHRRPLGGRALGRSSRCRSSTTSKAAPATGSPPPGLLQPTSARGSCRRSRPRAAISSRTPVTTWSSADRSTSPQPPIPSSPTGSAVVSATAAPSPPSTPTTAASPGPIIPGTGFGESSVPDWRRHQVSLSRPTRRPTSGSASASARAHTAAAPTCTSTMSQSRKCPSQVALDRSRPPP